MVEGNGLGYLHVMQPFLDRVGLRGGVSASRRLLWFAVGLSPFMLWNRKIGVNKNVDRA